MENPLFEGLFERAATSVGGATHAARLALAGRVAFHPPGGTHHGRPDRASGFCYFNDPVFAILALLDAGLERVLYVDLDAHHGDGVQDAFAGDPRVFTISVHETGRWPHTGAVDDRGHGRACNVPVPRDCHDAELAHVMDALLRPLALAVAPEAVVLTCGADALAGDPLARLAFTNRALWDCAVELAHLAPAAVVQGGGGYNPWTVARYWTGLWGRLSGRSIPETLPPSAVAILRTLECDLVEPEDIDPRWLTTLADPEPAQSDVVRPALRRVVDTALALLDRAMWRLPAQRSTLALPS
jgi:acetoin utilization protein AcuC